VTVRIQCILEHAISCSRQSGGSISLSLIASTIDTTSRIAGCVKYDLQEFCRLITVAGNGCIFLLFVGDHDEAHDWLRADANGFGEQS
jgi:hypothetical protein